MKNTSVEKDVLAGMMNSNDFMYDAFSNAHEDMFTDPNHKDLFNNIMRKSEKGSVTSNKMMQGASAKEEALINTIDGAWIDKEHAENALTILKDNFIKRQLNYSIQKVQRQMDTATSDEIISQLEMDISSFYFDDESENILDPLEYGDKSYREFEEMLQNPELAQGIPFSVTNKNGFYKGFPSLDKALNGAQGGDLIMIAAETGKGKTGLSVSLSRLFSLYQDYAGYYENAEMKVRELLSRLLAPIADVKVNELLYARLEGTTDERQAKHARIQTAYGQYQNSKIYLSRLPNLPLHKAKGLARQVKNRYKQLDYLFVDYVGRMTIEGKNGMQSWDEMYEITKQLKELAMTLNIPVFMLAQLKHDGHVEGAKKMRNECDAVLYFEEITENDKEYIDKYFREDRAKVINYKIIKSKVRRDDDPAPIYCNYDKKQQFVNEVPM